MLLSLFQRPLKWLKRFNQHDCSTQAAVLSFYTLLSIVPLLALSFGIAKGFNADALLEQQLYWYLKGQNETIASMLQFANRLIHHANGGLMALFGSILLLWSAFKLFSTLEKAFNAIFKIPSPRSIFKQYLNYAIFIISSPVLWIITSTFAVFMNTGLAFWIHKYIGIKNTIFIYWISAIMPIIMITLFLTWVYMALPNKKLKLEKAFRSALIVAILYSFIQWIYIIFQVGINQHGAIYGSFAAVPLFLLWIELSWSLVLFGAVLVG